MKEPLKQRERGKRERGNFPCLSATKIVHLEDVPKASSGCLESQLIRNFWNLLNFLDPIINLSP